MSMTDLIGVDRFDILPHLVSLAIAYALALPIGWNRERAERTAGLRTFPLVAVACCGIVSRSAAMRRTPSRQAQSVTDCAPVAARRASSATSKS